MKKVILVWAMALLSIGACTTQHYLTKTHESTVWERTCKNANIVLDIDAACLLTEPEVQTTLLLEGLGWYGAYASGGFIVYVLPEGHRWFDLDNTDWTSVVAHEMTHYINYFMYDGTMDRCENERIARVVESMESGVPYNDDWRPRYDC